MQIDQFLDVMMSRRSIRKFRPDPIPDEYIAKILESARWAMSGANGQPWEFIVIKSPEMKKKLAEIFGRYRDIPRAMEMTRLEEYRQPFFRAQGPREREGEDIQSRYTTWSDAPVIIAVLGDRRTLQASTLAARMFEIHTFDHNLANATFAIHLASAALGLGAQWVSIQPHIAEDMKPLLGIPTILTLFTLNPIGYPAIKPIPYRRELKEMVHDEKYDMSKFRSNEAIQDFIKYQRRRHADGGAYRIGVKESEKPGK